MNDKLFDLMTAEPVSTATNAHEQMDRLMLENDMAQINLEDEMYGAIRSSENFRPYTGVSQEDLFSMVTGGGGGVPMLGGMAKQIGRYDVEALMKAIIKRKGRVSKASLKTSKAIRNLQNQLGRKDWDKFAENIVDNPVPMTSWVKPGLSPYKISKSNLQKLQHQEDKFSKETINLRELIKGLSKYNREGYMEPFTLQRYTPKK